MKANSSICSFHIKKQEIRDKRYFVYHSKEYPVDFDLLKKNSNYFYKNKKQFKGREYIELINEKEEYVKLNDESIQAFISSIQNEPCSIENSSIIPLQYLAHKYEFNELIQFTDQYIADHSEELVFATLSFKIDEMDEKENNDSFFDTSNEERIISNNLAKFIQKDELLGLPIEIIYRILSLFYKHQTNKNEIKDDMTIFLFKCLDKYGRPASSLFNIIDFGEQKIEVVNRLLEKYSNQFDFNMINKTLSNTVKELTSEVTKQKEEYRKLFKEMKETFKEQLEELKEMKKQEEDKQKQNEIDNQKRINDFQNEVEKMKKEFEQKINFSQDQFKQICSKQEEFVNDFIVKKYHQIILKTITLGQFRKFDDDLKDHFLKELFKNKNEQKNENEILRAKLLLDLSSIPESYEYNQIVDFLRNNENAQLDIKLTKDKIEDLYLKNQLDSYLTSCVIAFNHFIAQIEYPCNKFEQIMKIITDIKSQNDQKMKIFVTINNESYFEQKYEWSKCTEIVFEVQYPSSNFSNIYQKIIGLKQNNSEKVKVGIFYTQKEVADKNFKGNKEINYVRFDSNIKRTPNDNNDTSDGSFYNCSSLLEVSVPSSLNRIGNRTFYSCSKLKKINFELPSSVNSIGIMAFDNCSSLTQITIPSSVTEIREFAFRSCSSLTQITIPSSVTKIGKYVFNLCSSLTQITIPSSVTSIGNSAFSRCKSLTQITIPSSVTSIDNYAFYECSSLTQITIPSSITSIGYDVFFNCQQLDKISIISCKEKRIEMIDDVILVFRTDSSKENYDTVVFAKPKVKTVTIPSFINTIKSYAFDGCSSLTQITFTIPSSVTSIEEDAFRGCSSLTQITIPSSVTSIGNFAFGKCSSLTQITFTIPSSVTSIGSQAFYNCSSLAQISIPSSVTSIGSCAFRSCSSLQQITIPSKINLSNLEINSSATINQI